MGSKVAQTPGGFMEAGDTNVWFSPDCVSHLLGAGFNPAHFGSYDQVNKQIMTARARCEAAERAARLGMPGASMIEPSPEDRFLASSTAGHMVHNSVAQGTRGDSCSNGIDGYNHDQAPACPMEKGTRSGGPQPGSIDREWSDNEQFALAARRPPAGAPLPAPPAAPVGRVGNSALDPRTSGYAYDPSDRQADERQRIDAMVAANPDRRRQYEAPSGPGTTAGSPATGAPGAVNSPTMSLSRGQTRAPDGSAVANGGDAAECIESFKNTQQGQMRARCSSEVERNAALATNGPAREAERARLEGQQAAANHQIEQTRERIANAQPPRVTATELQELHEQRADAQARHATATRALAALDAAGCMRDQGERIRGMRLGGTPADAERQGGWLPQLANI